MENSVEKSLDAVFDQVSGNKAPAVIGKPVFEKDLDYCRVKGYTQFNQLFGGVQDENGPASLPLNFGSKSATEGMPDEVRLRLFEMKKMFSNLEIISARCFKGQHVSPEMMKTIPYYKNVVAPMLKAYNVTDFSNFIPTLNARFYFSEYQLPFLLADEFDQVPMDSATVTVPGDSGFLTAVEETDAATFTARSTTQGSYTVNARNAVIHSQITEDLLADSAPAYIDKLRKDITWAIARAYESAIINGDDTVTTSERGDGHIDSDTAGLALNATFLKGWKGLRKRVLAANSSASHVYDHGGDTPSKVMFESLLAKMGKYGSDKKDLMYIVSPTVETAIVTGAIPELFTAFAFGSMASNVSGNCPPIFGIKVVPSQFVREDVNSSGVYASSQSLTSVLLVKKSHFHNFVRQAIRVWAAPSLPSSDLMLMSAKARLGFGGNPLSSSVKSAVMAINVKPS